jgi:formylglycine-generating enzyme required for sulfatase activity
MAKYLDRLRESDAIPAAARRENLPALTALLQGYESLLAQRPRLAAFLADAGNDDDAPHGGWSGGPQAACELRATVEALDHVLSAMSAPAAEIDKLRARIEWARNVEQVTCGAHERDWRRVRDELRADGHFADFALLPQVGLVPLGRDAASGLQEFALPLPGMDIASAGAPPGPSTCPVFVLVPGGTTHVGSQRSDPSLPQYDPHRFPNERSADQVRLAPFFACKYELTQGQWQRIDPCGARSTDDLFDQPTQPAVGIDAGSMRHALHAWGMRLPTSDEWDHLARGGAPTPWCCGADAASLRGHANVHDRAVAINDATAEGEAVPWDDDHVVTAPVGSFAPNGYALHDVHGNAIEVALRSQPEGGSPDLELRGGSWHQGALAARVTATVQWSGEPLVSIGVRPVISVRR